VESLAYASCLVQVAQTALKHETQPVCATGLTFMIERNMLKRRITAMLEQKKTRFSFGAVLPALCLTVIVLGATAYASQSLIQDRRVTLSQAEEMAKSARDNGEFPIVVNDLVLKWLNYFLGTPDGREKVRMALSRMENYRPTIMKKLEEYQMPEELLAVPLIEAGYQNLEPKKNPIGAAGLWQFISQTAQNFGLRVDKQVDERMNVELETDAAMRYLLANKLRFKDWQLSILSYNAGEATVQNAILKTGSRDPWVLVRSGFTNEESSSYLPKLMAAILIVKNPLSVQ
jgi:membrane-bound lytic murein transglycosylase D